eukprot:g41777.t1
MLTCAHVCVRKWHNVHSVPKTGFGEEGKSRSTVAAEAQEFKCAIDVKIFPSRRGGVRRVKTQTRRKKGAQVEGGAGSCCCAVRMRAAERRLSLVQRHFRTAGLRESAGSSVSIALSSSAPLLSTSSSPSASSSSSSRAARSAGSHLSPPSSSLLRQGALSIFHAALKAVRPERLTAGALRLTARHVLSVSSVVGTGHESDRELDLRAVKRVLVVGAGKAVVAMAQQVERFWTQQVQQEPALQHLHRQLTGIVITKHGHGAAGLSHIQVKEAAHPVPDSAGMQATQQMLDLLRGAAAPDTLVLVLVSGGCSALLTAPAADLTLADLQQTNQLLLGSGAPIHHVNVIRKHLSAVKGGRLAAAAAPSQVVGLVLSDVVGDPVALIGSGPTAPDQSTFQDCFSIMKKHGITLDQLPQRVASHLLRGLRDPALESPGPDSASLARASTHIIGSNRSALQAAEVRAKELGFSTLVLTSQLQGEAREMAQLWAGLAKETLSGSGWPGRSPLAVLAGGETTVSLRGTGKGGRNQEQAVAATDLLSSLPPEQLSRVCLLFGATDGNDGPTDSAGGLVDASTVSAMRRLDLDPAACIAASNSYDFLEQIGGQVRTGPTGTNVMDLSVLLVK